MGEADHRDGDPAEQPSPVARDAEAAGDEAAELERLRAEVAELRTRPEGPAPPHRRAGRSPMMRVRGVIAAILVAVAGFCAVASVVGVWGARTTLNTDRWVSTVGPLPQHPEVNTAMATYLTGQVFSELKVEQRLAQALPPKASFLAGPVTDAVRNYMYDTVRKFMATEQFQTLWNNANRVAHTQIMAILNGTSKTVSAQGSTVTLNLLPIVNQLLLAVSAQLPTLFGKKLDLPTLTSGTVPPGLRERIQTQLGVTLPADFAQIKLYNRNGLSQLQEAVVVFKRSVLLLVLGTFLLLVLALVISPRRRRTVLQFGVALSISVVVLSSVLRAVRDQLLGMVPSGVYREGATVAAYQIFTTLRERGDQLLWLGIAMAVLAYLVGPGRLAVALRRYAVVGARWAGGSVRDLSKGVATSKDLRRWTARHLDPLRIGGVIAAAVIVLLFSSWTALLVIALLLVGYEALVTLLAHLGRDAEEEPGGPAEPAVTEAQ